MKKLLSVFGLVLWGLTSQAQLVVDNTVTPEDAVQTILLGDGIEAFNITFNGAPEQIGSFNSQNSNIGIEEGVVLASGDVVVTVGPNDIGSATEGGGGTTDPDLEQLIPGFTLNDAAVLEFDFIAAGDSVSFRYVWGSEEYPEFVNSSFNDVFGFFLSGPGINGPYSLNAVNIALVPGTTLPVTIDNVNIGVNSQYYVDNTNGGANATQLDAFTTVLTAEAGGLQCGETYHIKIALADAGDASYDSAVFLEAGSFASNDVSITATIPNTPPNFPSLTLLEGCIDGFVTIFRPSADDNDEVLLIVGGTATGEEDYDLLPEIVTFPEGELTVEIPITTIYDEVAEETETITISYEYINSCEEEVTIEVVLNILDYTPPTLDLPDPVNLCGGASETVSAVPTDGFGPFQYTWSTGASSPSITVVGGGPDSIFVDLIDYCGFTAADSFAVIIPDPLVIPEDSWVCLGQSIRLLPEGGAQPFTWTYDTEVLSFNEESGTWSSQVEGIYTIELVDGCGEGGPFDLEVRVCDTTIPNIFSPNGDQTNDAFVIDGWQGFPGSRLEVFNRWGTLVYEEDNYQSNWRGDDLAEGTYFYMYYRSDGEIFSGTLNIVR